MDKVENVLIFLGGALVLAILFRETHVWWLERKDRHDYYEGLKNSLLNYAEELFQETDKRS